LILKERTLGYENPSMTGKPAIPSPPAPDHAPDPDLPAEAKRKRSRRPPLGKEEFPEERP
jgi:hypothetical protein